MTVPEKVVSRTQRMSGEAVPEVDEVVEIIEDNWGEGYHDSITRIKPSMNGTTVIVEVERPSLVRRHLAPLAEAGFVAIAVKERLDPKDGLMFFFDKMALGGYRVTKLGNG